MLFTSQPHSEGEERKPTFLEPAIGGSCAPSEDALHVNPNGTINAVLSPDNAEAQALGKEEGARWRVPQLFLDLIFSLRPCLSPEERNWGGNKMPLVPGWGWSQKLTRQCG